MLHLEVWRLLEEIRLSEMRIFEARHLLEEIWHVEKWLDKRNNGYFENL